MYCSQCGKQLADGEVCSCRQQAVQQTPVGSVTPELRDAAAVLKKWLSSWVVLTVAILYSALVLFTFINALVPVDYTAVLEEMESMLGIDLGDILSEAELGAEISGFNTVSNAISSCALPGLLCAGLWMLYAGARKKDAKSVSTGGFTMLKVVTIINFIGLCMVLALVLIVAFVVILLASVNNGFQTGDYLYTFDEPELVIMVCLLLMFIVIGVAVLEVIMFLKGLKTLNGAKEVATTGKPNNKASKFLMVMLYIAAGSGIVSNLTSLFTTPLVALQGLCQAAYCFFAAFALMQYRKEMNALYECRDICVQAAPATSATAGQARPTVQVEKQPQPYTVTYISCELCGQQYASNLEKCPKCGASDSSQK